MTINRLVRYAFIGVVMSNDNLPTFFSHNTLVAVTASVLKKKDRLVDKYLCTTTMYSETACVRANFQIPVPWQDVIELSSLGCNFL